MGPALLALQLMMLAAPVAAQTPFERQVLDALNQARTDPAGYAEALKRYRGYFHEKVVSLPDQKEDVETEEGVAGVDDAIAFLGRQPVLVPVQPVPLLEASAADLVRDQAASGDTGHESEDGSSPADRVRSHGGGTFVAEVIAYGPVDAVDAIRQLIVDDGVADRGHREILYAPELRYAGVSCGAHPEFRTMCVIDLAVTPDAHAPATQVARAKLPPRNAH
jgi:hypothetical protein